ncbi:MAG: S4 domain-containing protein [Burkholderiaceae bacterium]|nr:S4 domain-containing protein [Burkholderiaceae bacterium]
MTERNKPVRLDKWLWAARFFKTRALAAEAVDRGRIDVNGQPAKPARELHPGDTLVLRQDGGVKRTLVIRALSVQRGPARVAQALYEETADSLAQRLRAAEARRLAPEPAQSTLQGRPTKRDRRELERSQVQWQRWSASIDDPKR